MQNYAIIIPQDFKLYTVVKIKLRYERAGWENLLVIANSYLRIIILQRSMEK